MHVDSGKSTEKACLPMFLKRFLGLFHLVTDLDSVCFASIRSEFRELES